MNIEKKLLVSFMIMIMFTGSVFSQKSEEDVIRDIIVKFTRNIEALKSDGAAVAPALFSFASNNFKLEIKKINTMNVVQSESYDFKTVKAVISQMRASDLVLDRTLGPLDDVFVRDRTAYARYYNDYEIVESDRMINKGRQFVELIFRKYENDWKIEWMIAQDIDDLEYKGMCLCEIYENEGLKNIMTETIVPNGAGVYYAEDKFTILTDQEPRLVRTGFREYEWHQNGSVNLRNPDGTKGRVIGTAPSRQELILNLLKKEIYPDRCFNVVRKLK
ncbi:MAG TPA: hypothetical protein DCX54_04595 [Flavobacteriales bacterium]|nr:hypothetical protein [Flavobacteriales bacterium]